MEDTVKPALSPEEWRDGVPCGWVQRGDPTLNIWLKGENLEIDGPNGSVALPGAQRHAVAAVALHEQPFGFTRPDVDHLLRAADECGSSVGEHLREIAARLDALLPPS